MLIDDSSPAPPLPSFPLLCSCPPSSPSGGTELYTSPPSDAVQPPLLLIGHESCVMSNQNCYSLP